jgi:hypothetical protein
MHYLPKYFAIEIIIADTVILFDRKKYQEKILNFTH